MLILELCQNVAKILGYAWVRWESENGRYAGVNGNHPSLFVAWNEKELRRILEQNPTDGTDVPK